MDKPLIIQKLTESYIKQGVINSCKTRKLFPVGGKDFIIEADGIDYPAYCQSNGTTKFPQLKEMNLKPGDIVSIYGVVPKKRYRIEIGPRIEANEQSGELFNRPKNEVG